MTLKNKVAIVTGGARDIGRSCSQKLAAGGAKVVVNYFGSEAAANETVKSITDAGGEAIAVKADMTDPAGAQALVDAAVAAYGDRIDILVNVAGGIVARKTIEEMDVDFFREVMDLNLTSTFLATKAAKAYMGEGSCIVNLASQAGRDGGGPGASVYATSKGAVMTLTRAWAKEFGPQGIRVNALCPGMISTTFHDTFTADQVRKNVAGGTPLRREGHPDEIGDIVAYLASDQASFLTGVNMDTNGGLFMS